MVEFVQGHEVPNNFMGKIGEYTKYIYTGPGSTVDINTCLRKACKVIRYRFIRDETKEDYEGEWKFRESTLELAIQDMQDYVGGQLWQSDYKKFEIHCGPELFYLIECTGGDLEKYITGEYKNDPEYIKNNKYGTLSSVKVGKKIEGLNLEGHWLDNRVAEALKDFTPPFKIVREEFGEFVSINGRKGKRAIVVADANGKEFKCGKTQLSQIGL